MKKFLQTLTLFIVNCSLFIDLSAVKLCGRTCTWSSGTVSRSQACLFGNVCTCYASITTSSCSISTSWNGSVSCSSPCGHSSDQLCEGSCSCGPVGSGGSSSDVNPAAVTCPTNGTCADANFKTVDDGESCGSGYSERTSPTLTISGTYSDAAGTFTYGACTK